MSNYIIIALIVTSIIFIVFKAILQAGKKVENETIKRNAATLKTIINQKELLLEKLNKFVPECRTIMLLALAAYIIFSFLLPLIAPLFLGATFLFLIMYILSGMMRSSLKNRIEELKAYSNQRKKIN